MVDLSLENLRKLEVKPLHSSPCLHLLGVVATLTLHLLLVTLTTMQVVVVVAAASEKLPLSWLEMVK